MLQASHQLLIVEDHSMVRESLAEHVRALFPSVQTQEVGTLGDALQLVAAQRVDLVLLDLKLPDASGFSALVTMRKMVPLVPIVVVSGVVDGTLAQVVRSLGADEVLGKSARRDELKPLLSRWLGVGLSTRAGATDKPIFTTQQLVVLEHTLAGLSNKEIARATGLSAGTVRNLLSEVFLSFDVGSRSQLLALFQR